MRCDDVAVLLPELVDGTVRSTTPIQRHIESCLRCQAELARYRQLLRTLELLRTRYFEPSPGPARRRRSPALAEAGERRVVHSILTGGASPTPAPVGGAAVAAGAATAAVLVARSRRRSPPEPPPAPVARPGGEPSRASSR